MSGRVDRQVEELREYAERSFYLAGGCVLAALFIGVFSLLLGGLMFLALFHR